MSITKVSPDLLDLDAGITISVADNSDNLTLTSTDDDANSGPNLRLYRNSSSPTDDDVVGRIDFEGRNDNSQDVIYANIQGEIMQESDGSEDGQLQFGVMKAGTLTNAMMIDRTAIIINEDSVDLDFRVESNGNANMLFVDGGNDKVGIGTNSPAAKLHISQGSTGVSSLSRDASDYAIFLDAVQNTGYFQGALGFGESSSQVSSAIAGYDAGGSGAHGLIFATGTASALSERVRIDSSGNLGIGTTSPAQLRHVETTASPIATF